MSISNWTRGEGMGGGAPCDERIKRAMHVFCVSRDASNFRVVSPVSPRMGMFLRGFYVVNYISLYLLETH